MQVENVANVENVEQVEHVKDVNSKVNEGMSTDPLNQTSILTDDNSFVESESVNLNYSDENKSEKEVTATEKADVEMPEGISIYFLLFL